MISFKGKVILAHLLFTLAFTAEAQEAFVPETMIGLKAGANLSQFSFNPSVNQNMTRGYTGGVVFKHISKPKLGVQVELNYVQKGWTERVAPEEFYTRRLDYVELPFMTHVALGAKNTNFILNFGPNASYLLSSENGAEAVDEEASGYYHRDIDNPFMLGLSLGVGFVQKTSFGIFQLEGRFTQGLSNVFSNGPDLLASKNQSIGVTMSYLPLFRKKHSDK